MKLEVPYHLENFIGGHLIGPLSGNFIDNTNPATGEVSGKIPDSNEKDVNAAVMAAQKAFPGWSVTAVEERFRILNRIAELIDANLDTLALAETNDNGKPLWLSKKVDIPRASANFRFFATGIMHFATTTGLLLKNKDKFDWLNTEHGLSVNDIRTMKLDVNDHGTH